VILSPLVFPGYTDKNIYSVGFPPEQSKQEQDSSPFSLKFASKEEKGSVWKKNQ